ncbi:hypothetical protein LJC27_03960 [Christensenellaceae bacterium OttesenSCG-928-M15]|nr:hypothetical protein [Christensenellaceae bacterium OttesenSCG-928-M15]
MDFEGDWDGERGVILVFMEDILETYAMPYDPSIPMICMDEQPMQLLGEKLTPIAMKSGKPQI